MAQLGQPRHVFADLIAGNAGGDAFEFAAIFDRRVGLEVPRFQMAWAARLEQQDHAAFFRSACQRRFRPALLPQQIGQRHAAKRDGSALHETRGEKASNAERSRSAAGR